MKFLRIYAALIHAVRTLLARTGLLDALERGARKSRWKLWFRSLFSVLDFDDFIRLDSPWWSFKATLEVENFLASRNRTAVFEWGAGASTLWLSHRANRVLSVESDADWASKVETVAPPNAQIITVETPQRDSASIPLSSRLGFRRLDFSGYVNAIEQVPGKFDLIVIDGRARESCLRKSLPRLKPGGIILFDNTNRRRYQRALQEVAHTTTVETFSGLTPILPWPSWTSIIRLSTNPVHAANADKAAVC